MNEPLDRRPLADRGAEAAVLAAVVLAPWAFGSVEAWSEWLLYVVVVLAATLAVLGGRRSGRWRRLRCVPSLALLGLVALAIVQATPMPEGLLRRISPSAAADRDDLLPRQSGRVIGDNAPAVASPPATISRNPEATRDVARRLLAAWLVLQTVLALGGGRRTYRRFAAVVAANAAAMALFALVQALTWNGKIFWLRPSPMPDSHGWFTGGPFVSHGPLAAYLNLGLGLALGLMLVGGHGSGRLRAIRPGWAYAAGVLAFGVVASQSRGGFLGMAAASVLAMALFRPGDRRVWGGLAAMAGLVVVLLAALGSSSPLARLASILDADATGISVRLGLWRGALDAWHAAPVLGAGFGAFEVAVAPRLDRDLGLVFRRAENEYLDLLVEGGVVGLGLVLLLVGSTARLGLRAWRRSRSRVSGEPAMVLGGLFGLAALVVHSAGDFSPHIPGLSVAALALCGHLTRLGLSASPEAAPAADPPRVRSARPVLGRLATAGVVAAIGLGLIDHGWDRVRAESALAGSGVPLVEHVTRLDGVIPADASADDLARARDALRRALVHRPDWAAGHLLLARVHLGLYARHASDWIAEIAGEDGGLDAAALSALADPLWIHAMAHSGDRDEAFGAPMDHEPVRSHLVPAARCFLDARRCCPRLAEAHAGLASLDFLLEGDDRGARLASRADRLAGPDAALIGFLARIAAHDGDVSTASRRWRRVITLNDEEWPVVALASSAVLSPSEILRDVIPPGDGRNALRFADRLFADAPASPDRARFLQAAAAWLPRDARVDPADRLALEADAWNGLDRGDEASRCLEVALQLRPDRLDWRRSLVVHLVDLDDLDGARRQARIGLGYHPGDPVLRRAIDRIAERIASGDLVRAGDSASPPGDRGASGGGVL